jgi:hypothetical protein
LTVENGTSASPRPQSRETEGREYPQYSPLWNREREWLPWKSNAQEHGLKSHRVTPGGYVEEVGDDPIVRRKKIKAVSSRQWGRA